MNLVLDFVLELKCTSGKKDSRMKFQDCFMIKCVPEFVAVLAAALLYQLLVDFLCLKSAVAATPFVSFEN